MASQSLPEQIINRAMNTGCSSDPELLRCKLTPKCEIQMPTMEEIKAKLPVGARATLYIGDPNGGCPNKYKKLATSRTTCIRVLSGTIDSIQDEQPSQVNIDLTVQPDDQLLSEGISGDMERAHDSVHVREVPGLLISPYILPDKSVPRSTKDLPVSISVSTDGQDAEGHPKILGISTDASDAGRPTSQSVASFGNFRECRNAAESDAHWQSVISKMGSVFEEHKWHIRELLSQLKIAPVGILLLPTSIECHFIYLNSRLYKFY